MEPCPNFFDTLCDPVAPSLGFRPDSVGEKMIKMCKIGFNAPPPTVGGWGGECSGWKLRPSQF